MINKAIIYFDIFGCQNVETSQYVYTAYINISNIALKIRYIVHFNCDTCYSITLIRCYTPLVDSCKNNMVDKQFMCLLRGKGYCWGNRMKCKDGWQIAQQHSSDRHNMLTLTHPCVRRTLWMNKSACRITEESIGIFRRPWDVLSSGYQSYNDTPDR